MGSPNPNPVSTELGQVQQNLTAAQTTLTSIGTGVLGLDALIQQLQTQLSSSGSTSVLSTADQAVLDSILTASGNLATQASNISTAAPGTAPATPPAARKK